MNEGLVTAIEQALRKIESIRVIRARTNPGDYSLQYQRLDHLGRPTGERRAQVSDANIFTASASGAYSLQALCAEYSTISKRAIRPSVQGYQITRSKIDFPQAYKGDLYFTLSCGVAIVVQAVGTHTERNTYVDSSAIPAREKVLIEQSSERAYTLSRPIERRIHVYCFPDEGTLEAYLSGEMRKRDSMHVSDWTVAPHILIPVQAIQMFGSPPPNVPLFADYKPERVN